MDFLLGDRSRNYTIIVNDRSIDGSENMKGIHIMEPEHPSSLAHIPGPVDRSKVTRVKPNPAALAGETRRKIKRTIGADGNTDEGCCVQTLSKRCDSRIRVRDNPSKTETEE